MKPLTFATLLFISCATQAQNYRLEPETGCRSTGDRLDFKCEPAAEKYKIFIYASGQRWFKKHVWESPRSETKWELHVVKSNKDILVLSERVLFSGTRLLSIVNKSAKYYQTEVAYASFGNEVSVTYGTALRLSE
jgi:hypothetical protein